MHSDDYVISVKDAKRAFCVVLRLMDDEVQRRFQQKKNWSPAMEKLPGVNVGTSGAAHEVSKVGML